MNVQYQVPILNVSSLPQSFAWFEKVGWNKRWDWGDPPDFGSVGNAGFEIFLCLDCQGSRAREGGEGGTWLAWMLPTPAEVDAMHDRAVKDGLVVLQPPTDQEWNLREFLIRHPDGHVIRIGAPLEVEEWVPPTEPRLEVERVDVTVRLEQRLAALLADLARHKGMTVGECLEETLLHTFEPLGGGVASPHTPGQMAYIHELKRRHGVDYDCHASYRFTEKGPRRSGH